MPIVLAINENAAVLEQVSSILADMNIEVRCAQSGTQGIDLLRSIRPDLIITSADTKVDDNNPNIVEVIRHEDSRIPILILSGDAKQMEKQLLFLDMSNPSSALQSASKHEALSYHHFNQLKHTKRIKPLVLIVDEAGEIGAELQQAFQSQDMKTLLAENSEDGFDLFLEHRPDLIMADILMPKVSGVDLISKIREEDLLIPIVAVSGALDNSSEPLIKAGANKAVAKPFEPDRLVNTLIDDYYINRVPSLLVIEDNLIVSKTMDFLLRKAGYKVSVVKSGDEGLELMKNSPPFDLITLDVMMDGMDGYETCKMIRSLEDKAKREVFVVFVTGKNSIKERQKGFDVGGSEFISKDNLKGVLVPTVNRILRPTVRIKPENLDDNSRTDRSIIEGE